MDIKERIKDIEERLAKLEDEKRHLLNELNRIRNFKDPPAISLGTQVLNTAPETSEDKIELFMELFRCRDDVYPKYWENKTKGIHGFSPVCNHEWIKTKCNKPKVKCTDCTNKSFEILNKDVVKTHLEGKIIIGTYAIRIDDTCTFLATDFDKASWKDDILAYTHAARNLGIDPAIEISKSGNGAHAWIFFSEPIPAVIARRLGSIIMAMASQNRYSMSLESYDRFFPNQDTLPKGGFGNLIALPLQRVSRDKGMTVFVDDSFHPFPDQWDYLAHRKHLSLYDINGVLDNINKSDISIRLLTDDEMIKESESDIEAISKRLKAGTFVGNVDINLGSQLSINIESLPSKLINALKRTATFANPKFFELQRLRFSTWNTPRYICCAGIDNNVLTLPRGTLETCLQLVNSAGANTQVIDNRLKLKNIDVSFAGELTSEQEQAVAVILNYDCGVLVAPPGIGKTVMACAIIAKRRSPTLILVHRKQLMDQWKSQIVKFTGINEKEIGFIGASKKKNKGTIDIAMLQTLARMENHADYSNMYEQIIVDECHHIPAVSFELVLNAIPARYFLGLTATPYRKDGLQAIIHMQCGPIRHSMAETEELIILKRVIVQETKFVMAYEGGQQPPIHEVWDKLIADSERLELIAQDVKDVLASSRFPLILSERKEHLYHLAEKIRKKTNDMSVKEYILSGDMGKKSRKKSLDDIRASLNESQHPYILSTGSLIGEGFDLPELDTLFIAMPFSFKGRAVQYAGRLHRQISGKSDIIIYDYLDINSGLMISMFKKRLSAYKEMGYSIETSGNTKILKLIKPYGK